MFNHHLAASRFPLASVRWDLQGALPMTNLLSENPNQDERLPILLIAPAIVPFNATATHTMDPMEMFGRSLFRQHFSIHHTPYKRGVGFTPGQSGLINAVDIIVLVLTEFTSPALGPGPLDLAEIAREACGEDSTLVLVSFCPLPDVNLQALGFSTVVQAYGYTEAHLKEVASLIMDEQATPISPEDTITNPRGSIPPQQAWSVEKWDYERDLGEVHTLWQASLPAQFNLPRFALSALLVRHGSSMHYVVRNPSTGNIVGFCATFTSFAGKSVDQLIGSIATIIVREDYRNRGIGRILHDEGWSRLSKIRDVGRIQLGSTFPRLLHGPPVPLQNPSWFEDRGWSLDEMGLGRGRIVTDWFLRFADSPIPNFASAGLAFRTCQITDQARLLDMVARECERKSYFGWYDQYARTVDSSHMTDVILGFEGESLVAAAVTYAQNSGSPCALDIPWAAVVGEAIGGVSCICIKDDDPDMANRRDSVLARLLQACRQSLNDRGMVGMFVDGMRSDENTFMSLDGQVTEKHGVKDEYSKKLVATWYDGSLDNEITRI